MQVAAIEGVYNVVSGDDLESVLMRRVRDGVNFFWLSHGPGGYPTLSIMVKGDLASLNYMRRDRDAGFQSVGHMAHLEGESTNFTISMDGEQIIAQNDSVVPFCVALEAAKEFIVSDERPESVEWDEL